MYMYLVSAVRVLYIKAFVIFQIQAYPASP